MGIRGPKSECPCLRADEEAEVQRLPAPTASYRRRAWIEFQRALDPLAPVKPLRPPPPRF
jgi:hypothetical protein